MLRPMHNNYILSEMSNITTTEQPLIHQTPAIHTTTAAVPPPTTACVVTITVSDQLYQLNLRSVHSLREALSQPQNIVPWVNYIKSTQQSEDILAQQNTDNSINLNPSLLLQTAFACYYNADKYRRLNNNEMSRFYVLKALWKFLDYNNVLAKGSSALMNCTDDSSPNVVMPVLRVDQITLAHIWHSVVNAYLLAGYIEQDSQQHAAAHNYFQKAYYFAKQYERTPAGYALGCLNEIVRNCEHFDREAALKWKEELQNAMSLSSQIDLKIAPPTTNPIYQNAFVPQQLVSASNGYGNGNVATMTHNIAPVQTGPVSVVPMGMNIIPAAVTTAQEVRTIGLPITPTGIGMNDTGMFSNAAAAATAASSMPSISMMEFGQPKMEEYGAVNFPPDIAAAYPPIIPEISSSSSSSFSPIASSTTSSTSSSGVFPNGVSPTNTPQRSVVNRRTPNMRGGNNRTGEKNFQCGECQRWYATKASLRSHARIHTDAACVCNECGKKFPNVHKLKIHAVRHTGVRPFQCDLCQKRFTDKCNLKRHYRRHTGEKPFQCRHCSKCFTDSTALIDHTRRKHTKEKPYECEECGKRFVSSSDLKNHAAVHSDVRPYQCSVCGTRFKRKNDYKKHMLQFHQMTIKV